MNLSRGRQILCAISIVAISVSATAQDSGSKKRLTPQEVEALPGQSGGAGTSGLADTVYGK